ncbi:hypothetical protein PpBr36_08316 [Pyricularia pennisetigena]|uniref:hypothetical protein n=1 Tax=Pyricularia pennisetigena TaxID=1578925 RepID=UPI00114E5D09|nr:hypothetical protein PpBr36_08316 [Pyricularia pennisetigena]TLS24648.1 hypothetical protein PpBr36_08316 [Pyricularia pennisetigena]
MPKFQVGPSDRCTRSQAHGLRQTRWVRGEAGESLAVLAGAAVAGSSMQRDDEGDDDGDDENEDNKQDQEQKNEDQDKGEEFQEHEHEDENEDEDEGQDKYQQNGDEEEEEDYDCGQNEDVLVEHTAAEEEEDGKEEDENEHEQDEDQDEEDLDSAASPSSKSSRTKRTGESGSQEDEPPIKRLRRGRRHKNSTRGSSPSSQPPPTRRSSTSVDSSSKPDKGREASRRRSKAPSPQPARESAPAAPTTVRVVIFVRDDDILGPAFSTSNSYCQSVPYLNRQNQFHKPAWTLALADVESSDPGLAKYIQHGHGFHQSIVTALHILEEGKKGSPEDKFDVKIRAWTDGAISNLLQELQTNNEASGEDMQPEPQPYTIILVMDTSMNDPTETPKPYDEFAARPAANVRIYPCRQEMEGDNGKMHDIYAFDEAAVVTGTAAARPTTCFGLSGRGTDEPEACPLRDEQTTMYKRSWSGFGNHVRAIDGRHLPLTCLPIPRTIAPAPPQPARKARREPTRRNPDRDAKKDVSMQTTHKTTAARQMSTPGFTDADFQLDLRDGHARAGTRRQRWFHQRLVPALRRGEFRVFVGTQKSAGALRGRAGYVVQVVHTATRRDPVQCRDYVDVLAPSADEDDDGTNDWMGARVRDVQDFALATFEALRRRRDRAFESLDVGCRMDIGVAEAVGGDGGGGGGGGGLFVNELTRWYGATYFSNDALALPKTRICARFARSFADWVRTGGYREAEEWEEEE